MMVTFALNTRHLSTAGDLLAWIRGLAGSVTGVDMRKVPFDLRQSGVLRT